MFSLNDNPPTAQNEVMYTKTHTRTQCAFFPTILRVCSSKAHDSVYKAVEERVIDAMLGEMCLTAVYHFDLALTVATHSHLIQNLKSK